MSDVEKKFISLENAVDFVKSFASVFQLASKSDYEMWVPLKKKGRHTILDTHLTIVDIMAKKKKKKTSD